MEKKYYTPELEEFHVGFEYEYKLGAYDKGLKTKEEFDSKDWERDVFDGLHFPYLYRALNGLNAERGLCHIRVKYLDREDIESLGFKSKGFLNTNTGYPTLEVFEKLFSQKIYDKWTIRFSSKGTLLVKQGSGDRFYGTIKNKSELKRLLKQLGI